MNKILPEVSKQIHNKNILKILEKNYSEIMPIWVPMQLQWLNRLYKTFYDYDKFMIIIHLLVKTFNFYSKNFVKLNYHEYFNQTEVEIKEINIMEISNSLNIPKETTRRKVNELEALGTIKRIKKIIIIDKETWPTIKPEETMTTIKENFSYVWKFYFEMQMPMMLSFKKIFGDLETMHIHGTCLANQVLNSKKIDNSKMSKEFYLKKYFTNDRKKIIGINAMSISDITGIPRATVIRKLKKLVKENFLAIDKKKHYSVIGFHIDELEVVQKNTFINLTQFAELVYNLCLNKK